MIRALPMALLLAAAGCSDAIAQSVGVGVGVSAENSNCKSGAPSDPVSGSTLYLSAKSVDGSGNSTFSDDDPVGIWSDLSGNSRDFTGAGGARPTFKQSVGGRPAVLFDGTDDVITATDLLGDIINDNAFSVYAVVQPVSIASTGNAWQQEAILCTVTGFWGLYTTDNTANSISGFNWDGNADVSEIGVTESEDTIATYKHEGGNIGLAIKQGAFQLVASGDTSNVGGSLAIGRNTGGGSFYDGYIRALIVYDFVLNTSQHSHNLAFLSGEWGL